MRAMLPIALLALLGVLSVAAEPPAPAAPIDWQDAIQQLRGEREQAQTCLAQLREHGDAYRIDQGERFYALAKVHMDQAYRGVQDALTGKTARYGSAALEAQIDQAIEGRLKLCRLLDGIVPDAAGEKGPLVMLLTRNSTATKAAARALLAQCTAEPLERETIKTQLGAAQWSKAAQLPAAPKNASAGPADAVIYPVWFGTNRRPDPDHPGQFTNTRFDRTTYGRAEVVVPQAHRFGETGNPAWKRLQRLDLRDDQLRLQQVSLQDQAAWVAALQETLAAARRDGGPSQALVFLHGYNVGFADAAIQAAQLGFDLKVPATAFFSWPSKGALLDYPADEASIEASEAAIAEFLVAFCSQVKADQVHLVAHSMGNRGLLRALQRIAADVETRGRVRLGQVFLAAPDLDRDLFLDLARLYPQFSQRTTLYASNGDLALLSSRLLHEAPRAGYFKPYTVAHGIDTVAVPDFNIDLLGHAYYAQAEALLGDIHGLMLHNEAPDSRPRLEPASEDGQRFWRMRR